MRSLKILVRELLHTTIRPIRKLKNDQCGQNFKRKRWKRVLKSAWSENRQLRGYKQLFLSKIAARRAAKILGAQKFQKRAPGFQKGTRVILRKRRGPRFRGQGSLGEATFPLPTTMCLCRRGSPGSSRYTAADYLVQIRTLSDPWVNA